MNKKPLAFALTVLAVFGSATWIYVNRPGRLPKIQLDPYWAMGEVAGEETGRLLNHKGQAVIITRDNTSGANPVAEAGLTAFTATLEKGGVGIAAIERFSVPPAAQLFLGGAIPRERFLQVLQARPKATALVLLAEFPALDKPDLDLLERSGTKIVLISGNPPTSKGFIDAGVAHLAVVPHTNSPPDTSQPAQGIFNRYYVVLPSDKSSGAP